jgi:hypothetical protein
MEATIDRDPGKLFDVCHAFVSSFFFVSSCEKGRPSNQQIV